MKKRITKIVGVVLSLALLSSLAMVAAPVTAAPGTNAFGAVTLPAIAPDTDVELLAVAVDGTLFASVYDDNDGDWTIYKSTDGGWTWTATKFKDHDAEVSAIVCAPNWGDEDTFYVSTEDGKVYRCIDAGSAEPVLLRAIVGNDPDHSEDLMEASEVYDMDLWTDGGSMWIMVATDIDVLVMEDTRFAEWIDMDLTISFDGVNESQDGTTHGDFQAALITRFAPDFDQSGLIWTILRDEDGDAWLSATISPGQWGQVVNSVEIPNDSWLRHEIDLDFASWYSSTSAPVLFAAIDDLYLIEGGFDTDSSVATPLEVDGGGIDFQSIQVDNEVIMGGEFYNANIWISRNGGDTFNEAVKPPTGNDETQVLMAPGDFDPDEGVAYAATSGPEGAFSYTMDGGDTWNQTAFVDTEIDVILDMAFSTATASQPAVLITDNNGDAESVWRTGDITAATPQWERVYCTTQSENWDFELVTYAMDGSSILLSVDDDGDNKILKSTDNGQTWSTWRTLPSAIGDINDWVVYDSATVFAACDDGFYGTTRFGPAKQKLTGTVLVSIALQPGFDPNDPDNATVIVGDDDACIYISDDAGSNWGTQQDVIALSAGNVYVAFDQLDPSVIYYATSGSIVGTAVIDGDELDDIAALEDSEEDTAEANSFSCIWVSPDNALYAIGGDTPVSTTTWGSPATVSGNIVTLTGVSSLVATAGVVVPVTDITVLSGSFTQGTENLTISGAVVTALSSTVAAGTVYVTGATSSATGSFDIQIIGLSGYEAGEDIDVIVAAAGDLQSIRASSTSTTTEDAYLFRLLLGEPYNIWETEQKDGAMGLWGFEGSNFLLTVVDSSSLYGLEDTLSGKVTGVTVSSIGENSAKVSWTAMTDAELYEVLYDGIDNTVVTEETSKTLSGLDDGEEYTVQVRVATDEDFQSRWSTEVSFTTLQAIAQPVNLVPVNGMQDAPLLPSFVWEEVSNAVEYEFQLSTDPGMGNLLVDITTENTAYTLTMELAYDTNHYWQVRAVSGTGTKSTWCFSNFHTRTEEIPPVTVEPPPTPNITLPAPQVTVIPPDVDVTLPAPQVTVVPPDITVDVPDVVTVTQQAQQAQPTLVLPIAEKEGTPVYIWVIVGIGAILTIAVIVLIIRTRRVV